MQPLQHSEHYYCCTVLLDYLLYFLPPPAVHTLLAFCQAAPDTAAIAGRTQRLLQAPVAHLYDLVARPGDAEDKVAYLNVFLWRQKYGDIGRKHRIKYDFYSLTYDIQLIHRFMIANGYEGIEHMRLNTKNIDIISTYDTEIEHYLDAFRATDGFQEASGYAYDDDFTSLATYLTIIGPIIHQHPRLAEIRAFVDYLLDHWQEDSRLAWLSPGLFTMMVADLHYDPARTWPLYQLLCPQIGLFDYPALLLGIRMYGDVARATLQHQDIPGGYALLEALSSTEGS